MSNSRKFRRQLAKSPFIRAKKVATELKTRLEEKAVSQLIFGYAPHRWEYPSKILWQTTQPQTNTKN